MIKLKDAKELEKGLRDYLDSYFQGTYGIRLVTVGYSGCNFNVEENKLKIALELHIKKIEDKEEVKDKDYIEVEVIFEKEYTKDETKNFDILLNLMAFTSNYKGTYIVFNRGGDYFNILYTINKLFKYDIYTKDKEHIEKSMNSLKYMLGAIDKTIKTPKGMKAFVHNLREGVMEELYVFDILDEGIKGVYYTNNKKYIIYLYKNDIKVEKGSYKRFPNHTTKVINLFRKREINKEDIATGVSLIKNGYIRALNQLKYSGVEFSDKDKDVYKTNKGKYIRVSVEESEKPKIEFYELDDNLQGRYISTYYIETLFKGRVRGLRLIGDNPDYDVDANTLKDIYEDHIKN